MLARNAGAGARARLAPGRAVRLGARHEGFSLQQSLEYIDWVVEDYGRHGGLDAEALAGARVLELGPGDNLGVALRLLAMGAERVVCLDRFVTRRDAGQQRQINLDLAGRLPAEQRDRLEPVLSDEGEVRADQDRLVLIEGTGVEDATSELGAGSFDVIVSRAVLAHVFELERAFEAMDALLAAGGVMAHKVDLSDHRLFSDAGHNPLTYLTIPDRVYDRMRRHTGLVNRALTGDYGAQLSARGYEAELKATKLIGSDAELSSPAPVEMLGAEVDAARPLIDEIRPRLLERFAALPDEELAVSGLFIRARKPA
jgi:SAM-dependent methyltransferase